MPPRRRNLVCRSGGAKNTRTRQIGRVEVHKAQGRRGALHTTPDHDPAPCHTPTVTVEDVRGGRCKSFIYDLALDALLYMKCTHAMVMKLHEKFERPVVSVLSRVPDHAEPLLVRLGQLGVEGHVERREATLAAAAHVVVR